MELLEKTADRLRRNGFEVTVAADARLAGDYIREKITSAAPQIVSYGDSMTLYSTGTVEWLRGQERYRLIDTCQPGVQFSELLVRRREALMCDLFMTGVNAISLSDGSLHWLDMIGNRIAPVAFGPRDVVLVAGRNKIVETPEEAFRRIRDIAAPKNVARHEGMKNPCAVTGRCSDCSSPQRICNERLILHKCHPKGRITVVLIDEELGL